MFGKSQASEGLEITLYLQIPSIIGNIPIEKKVFHGMCIEFGTK